MTMKRYISFLFLALIFIFVLYSCKTENVKTTSELLTAPLFEYQNLEPRWNSFENPTSEKGTGGQENKGAKGHPFDSLLAGESKVLMDVEGPGIITRMWFTIQDRSPEILPQISGKGRFLGVNFGVMANPAYHKSWWGEGEVKMYLDGDGELPTLVGTGTEDYIGTAWGQGKFINRYTGCLVADSENGYWTFYRYHIPDPIFFENDIRVTIQAMGGNQKEKVIEMMDEEAPMIPVTIQNASSFVRLLDFEEPADLKNDDLIDGWTNFYRSDDWSSTAYFYLDKPTNQLPEIQNVEMRTYKLTRNE